MRLGENSPRKVDFRLIAATHRNLRDEIAVGKFRKDLFYRIAVTTVSIPPLRDRKDDLPGLIAHWLTHLCERYGLPATSFDDEAYACLLNYDWPGNVRELRNAIEGSLLMAQDDVITLDKLPSEITIGSIMSRGGADQEATPPFSAKIYSLEKAEAESIREALAYNGGNLTKAAFQLGIAKSTLYQKIRKYGLLQAVSETRGRQGSRVLE